MKGTDLRHLEFLSEMEWGRTHLKELLYSPHVTLWQSMSAGQFSDGFDALTSHLGPDSETSRMLALHLITEALLQREETPGWFSQWVCKHLDVAGYVEPLDWQTCIDGQWDAVPIFLVHEQAYLRYFILGVVAAWNGIALWPTWADCLMDEAAKIGIASAVKACHDIHPFGAGEAAFLYPLTLPNQRVQLTDISLGLSISLGFMSLLSKEKLSGDIAASGTIQVGGSVGKVGRLSAKTRYAGKARFRVFLFPSDNQPPSPGAGINCLPVSTLAEAWTLARLYTPGQAQKLPLMSNMLADPVAFINNCASVPPEWLEWVNENGRIRHVVNAVSNSPDLFEALVKKLDGCLDNGDITRGRVLVWCTRADAVEKLKESVPVSAFKWFTLNLAMANHIGDVASAREWEAHAEAMVRQSSLRDTEAFAAFCNHRLVGLYHNRYHFDPKLPSIVRRVMDALESQYKSQQYMIENPVNEALGALYGTVAQSCGFCGPQYLADTKRYADLSRRAFGDGNAPELREHWLRQYNYLTYAYLDAGNWMAAEMALLDYLQIMDWSQLWPKISGLSQWHHALLCRFFADCGIQEAGLRYMEWASQNREHIVDRKHPWQLWCYNMGRLNWKKKQTEPASLLFLQSLDICLAGDLGPTVQVMALLPLSGLWQAEMLGGVDLKIVEKRIRNIANDLNADHFRPFLREPDLEKVLNNVWTRPGEMFPFTYR